MLSRTRGYEWTVAVTNGSGSPSTKQGAMCATRFIQRYSLQLVQRVNSVLFKGYSWKSQNTLGTTIAGEDIPSDVLKVEMRNNATYISTATTTVCKTGAGLLNTITVTGGTAGTIVVYDNTAASGTILASFSSTMLLLHTLSMCHSLLVSQ